MKKVWKRANNTEWRSGAAVRTTTSLFFLCVLSSRKATMKKRRKKEKNSVRKMIKKRKISGGIRFGFLSTILPRRWFFPPVFLVFVWDFFFWLLIKELENLTQKKIIVGGFLTSRSFFFVVVFFSLYGELLCEIPRRHVNTVCVRGKGGK